MTDQRHEFYRPGRTSFILALICLCMIAVGAHANKSHHSEEWKAGTEVSSEDLSKYGADHFFRIDTISDALLTRMQKGGSFPVNCTVNRSDLRYLQLLHVNYEGKTIRGEIVCNKSIAQDLKAIFMELYKAKYEIEHVVLIDEYNANDEESMSNNNTSCFCYRTVNGTKSLSKHARGLAVDINPLHNPCARYNSKGKMIKLEPNNKTAREYAKRSPHKPHMIDHNDLCYKLFIKHGFKWGGNWKLTKDYQHFEK